MKKNLKYFSLMLAMVLIVGTFAGCGGKSEKVIEYDENGRMVITWLGIPWNSNIDPELSYAKKLIEDKFNVSINMLNYDNEAYAKKKPTLFASGEVPDIVYEMDPANVQTDAEQGFIMELPYAMLEEKCPDIYAELNKVAPANWVYSRYEGKNYGIPNINYAGGNNSVSIWRTDWLENVGIDKIPETIDEMHDALYKFTHNDPDGNGKNDTYGMSGDIKNWAKCFDDIFCAYGVQPFCWREDDGSVVYSGVADNDKIKEVLTLLSSWYKEGIIDPEFISDDIYNSIVTKFKNGKVGYISHGGAWKTNTDVAGSLKNTMKQINPKAEVAPALPIKGPNGDQGTFTWGKGAHVNAIGSHVKDQPEKLDKILEIFEYMSEHQDFAVQLRIGEEGTHYKFINESRKWLDGTELLPPYDTDGGKYGITLLATGQKFFSPICVKQETLNGMMTEEEAEFNKVYIKEELAKGDLFMKPDSVASASRYLKDLQTEQLVYISDIIRGNKQVEAYDEFITKWENTGGKTLQSDAEALLKDRESIYNEIGIR